MLIREFNERKYGVATKFVFAVPAPATSSSDRFFNAASPFVVGDVKVAKEATPGAGLGAFSDVGTLPTRIGTSAVFELSLTGPEMQGSTIVVQIVDQDGPAFRDMLLIIRTVNEQGNVDWDASQLTNKSAFKVTGQGSGHGIEAIGGATGRDIDGVLAQHTLHYGTAQTHGVAAEIKLVSTANANDDYYNGAIILLTAGTGAGQGRLIVDYVGSTKVATMDSGWVVNPDNTTEYVVLGGARTWQFYRGELASLPADGADMASKMQLIFQRFSFKITQTATVQTLFKADSATSLATRSVGDAAGTQTVGKLS